MPGLADLAAQAAVGRKKSIRDIMRPADKRDGGLQAKVLRRSFGLGRFDETHASRRRAGRTLSNRTMRAPVVEIAHILGQNLPQMALIEDEDVAQALGPDRSEEITRPVGRCVLLQE
jgi:hypothetical protein